MRETCLRLMRCPVYRRRDSNLGFRMELENLADDGKVGFRLIDDTDCDL